MQFTNDNTAGFTQEQLDIANAVEVKCKGHQAQDINQAILHGVESMFLLKPYFTATSDSEGSLKVWSAGNGFHIADRVGLGGAQYILIDGQISLLQLLGDNDAG